jgi:hypothetical protein
VQGQHLQVHQQDSPSMYGHAPPLQEDWQEATAMRADPTLTHLRCGLCYAVAARARHPPCPTARPAAPLFCRCRLAASAPASTSALRLAREGDSCRHRAAGTLLTPDDGTGHCLCSKHGAKWGGLHPPTEWPRPPPRPAQTQVDPPAVAWQGWRQQQQGAAHATA